MEPSDTYEVEALAWPEELERLRAENARLREQRDKAMDGLSKAVATFIELDQVLRLFGRPILADACNAAARGIEQLLKEEPK